MPEDASDKNQDEYDGGLDAEAYQVNTSQEEYKPYTNDNSTIRRRKNASISRTISGNSPLEPGDDRLHYTLSRNDIFFIFLVNRFVYCRWCFKLGRQFEYGFT